MRRWTGLVLMAAGLLGMVWMMIPAPRASSADGTAHSDVPALETAELPPKLVVDECNFDIGVLDIGEHCSHEFVLRNEGPGELTITSGGTSCQCTHVTLSHSKIRSGEEARVLLEWEPREPTEEFTHGVVLNTNDPVLKQVMLRGVGKVRRHLAASQEEVAFVDVPIGESRSQSILIHSQASQQLRIISAQTSNDWFEVRTEPASDELLERNEARSGQTVEIALRPQSERAELRGEIELEIESDDVSPDRRRAQILIPVMAEIAGDVSFYGAHTSREGLVQLGSVRQSQGTEATVYLVVRRAAADLTIERIETSHPWLTATAVRSDEPNASRARFRIRLEVSPAAPEVTLSGDEMAHVRLHTTHPDHPTIDLAVAVAVFR